jgi:preprotein translocase subunit SecD
MSKRTRFGLLVVTVFVVLGVGLFCLRWFDFVIPFSGGTELHYKLDLSEAAEDPEVLAAKVRGVVSRRLYLYGLRWLGFPRYRVAVEGEDHLLVSVPVEDPESTALIAKGIETLGVLCFQLVAENLPQSQEYWKSQEAAYLDQKRIWAQAKRDWNRKKAADPRFSEPSPTAPKAPPYVVRNYVQKENPEKPDSPEKVVERMVLDNSESAKVPGEFIANALPTTDTQSGGWAVAFQMTSEGASRLGDLTGLHVNKRLAIVLDGEIKSAPNIESRITTEGIIRGSFSQAEVVSLVNLLRSGGLPVKLIPLSRRVIQ